MGRFEIEFAPNGVPIGMARSAAMKYFREKAAKVKIARLEKQRDAIDQEIAQIMADLLTRDE